jgi:diguanylate cyclase
MDNNNDMVTLPAHASTLAIAREALRHLAQSRLPPTPDHYARAYQAIAAPGAPPDPYGAATMLREFADHIEGDTRARRDAAELRTCVDAFDWPRARQVLQRLCARVASGEQGPEWSPLIRDLVREWELRSGEFTQARKREALEHVLTAFAERPDQMAVRLQGLVRTWREAALATAAQHSQEEARSGGPDSTRGHSPASVSWRELLAALLGAAIQESLGYPPEMVREAVDIAASVRAARDPAEVNSVAQRLKQLLLGLERVSEDYREVQHGLLRLLRMLALNLTELVGSDTWLRGQLNAVTALAQGPVDMPTIVALERALRDITLKQGVLKHSLDEAKCALRDMVSTFVERLATLADDYGGYHDRLSGYATRIHKADDLASLSDVVRDVMQDTRGLQSDLARTRDELIASRQRVDEYQEQIHKLESEMASLSDRVHEDDLTHLLNRRGLARAFESEVARAERHARPLCLALLDVDDFKQLNDRMGHAAGDNALVHLARIVRRSLRPTDVICRYGGEEFVVLLPETELIDASNVMIRAQRQLTKHLFLGNDEHVVITFSAGVAQWQPGESRDAVTARADSALYRAKQAGKNRVATA